MFIFGLTIPLNRVAKHPDSARHIPRLLMERMFCAWCPIGWTSGPTCREQQVLSGGDECLFTRLTHRHTSSERRTAVTWRSGTREWHKDFYFDRTSAEMAGRAAGCDFKCREE